MKFNKVLIGLMVVTPFALTSCNSAMSYNQALSWVKSHYKTEKGGNKPAVISYDWDYHKTTGEDGKKTAEKVTEEVDIALRDSLYKVTKEEPIITFHENESTGHRILVKNVVELIHMNETSFKDTYEGIDGAIYKVNNDQLTVNFTYELECLKLLTEVKDPTVTFVRVYNSRGYCTDAGMKTGRKYISKGNFIDMKILLKFTYEDSGDF